VIIRLLLASTNTSQIHLCRLYEHAEIGNACLDQWCCCFLESRSVASGSKIEVKSKIPTDQAWTKKCHSEQPSKCTVCRMPSHSMMSCYAIFPWCKSSYSFPLSATKVPNPCLSPLLFRSPRIVHRALFHLSSFILYITCSHIISRNDPISPSS